MAGFRKAKPEQAMLKLGCYGPSGSGKTFTSLLLAEGLAQLNGKRIAFVDTERGTDFYAQDVPARSIHPEAFDFDALYTRSLVDILSEVQRLSPEEYGVVILDSMTHVWEAAIGAYKGKTTRAGTIPMHAWGKIKKPYKQLMEFVLNSPMHVIICGRQGNEYAEDEKTEEIKMVGYKMKAEGETPYEPHILIRMEANREGKSGFVVQAVVEKDRTGVLAGKVIREPNFDKICRPLLPFLGETQAQMQTAEDAAAHDAEELSNQDAERERESNRLFMKFMARFEEAAASESMEDVEAVGKQLTKDIKDRMLTAHVTQLRDRYRELTSRWTRPQDAS